VTLPNSGLRASTSSLDATVVSPGLPSVLDLIDAGPLSPFAREFCAYTNVVPAGPLATSLWTPWPTAIGGCHCAPSRVDPLPLQRKAHTRAEPISVPVGHEL
jgi:hypothetical protein